MSNQDNTPQIKEKIIQFLRLKGPSLPIHIAKEVGLNLLFTSAFLSELSAERRLKSSYMKVGSSAVYFLEGQEQRLEKFGEQFFKSREKDAFLRLKQRKFLKDTEQEPPIRVALRAIKDFAIPFTSSRNELVWRYFTASPIEYEKKFQPPQPLKPLKPLKQPKQESEDPLDIFDKSKDTEKNQEPEIKEINEEAKSEKNEKETPKTSKPKKKKTKTRRKSASKANEKFFNKVKEYLSSKNIEILDIEGFSRSDISLKIKKNGNELLLVAYNKKRITEKDILNASKKAETLNLRYMILSLGDSSKKIQNLLKAVRSLDSLKKIE